MHVLGPKKSRSIISVLKQVFLDLDQLKVQTFYVNVFSSLNNNTFFIIFSAISTGHSVNKNVASFDEISFK